MTRPLPPRPEAIHGASALQSYPDEALVLAAALLALDHPALPPIPAEPPCVCGHERLYHNDRWDAGTVSLAIAAGPCTQCVCGIYREPGVDDDIAAVRAGICADYGWTEVAS